MTKLQSKAINHAKGLIKEAMGISTIVYEHNVKNEKYPFDFNAQNEARYSQDRFMKSAFEWLDVIEQ